MAVSTKEYCKYKYGKDLISEEHRLAMCNLVSDPTNHVNAWDKDLAIKMNKLHHNSKAEIFLVSGADKGNKNYSNGIIHRITVARDGYEASQAEQMPENTLKVSATEIRNTLEAYPLSEALTKLEGILPAPVCDYILKNPDSVASMQADSNKKETEENKKQLNQNT